MQVSETARERKKISGSHDASRRPYSLSHRRRKLSGLEFGRQAPSFTKEWVDNQRIAISIFPSLPAGMDSAVQLVGEAIRLTGAWASINSKRISSLTKLWQRLACYRDSLAVHDPACYCMEKAALFNTLVGCEMHRCPVPCQFIWTPCMGMAQEGTTIYQETGFEVAAILAEIDWCPGLKLPTQSGPSRAGPPKDKRVRL